jgi:hypothetical protein
MLRGVQVWIYYDKISLKPGRVGFQPPIKRAREKLDIQVS